MHERERRENQERGEIEKERRGKRGVRQTGDGVSQEWRMFQSEQQKQFNLD